MEIKGTILKCALICLALTGCGGGGKSTQENGDGGVNRDSGSDTEVESGRDAGGTGNAETVVIGEGDKFLTVMNHCPFPIWSHVLGFDLKDASPVSLDDGRPAKIPASGELRYEGVPWVGGGRVYAYYKEPASGDRSIDAPVSYYNQFVEMTFDDGLNYNISFVDYAALPVSIRGGKGCPETACPVPLDEWKSHLDACPTELLEPHNGIGKCMASYNYCVIGDRNTSDDYCTKMEVYGHSGTEIYGGYFPERPSEDVEFWDWVAAWNRGTFAGDTEVGNYYQEPQKEGGDWKTPYNEYAKWVHKTLGCDVYAFSTDDHQNHGGFVRCTDSQELIVTWCPAD